MPTGYTSTDAISDMMSAGDSESILQSFRKFVGPLHIDTFTSGEVDIEMRRRVVFHAMEWPERWRNYYFQSGLVQHDPLIEALAHMNSAFTWNELRARRALSVAGTEAINKIAAEGWVDGLVVALKRSDTHYGLVSLVSMHHHITSDEKRHLEAVAMVFHERMRQVVPKEGFRIPPAGLTPREIECIGLVADGLSDFKAGERLGIRASTVHEHIERAKAKMQAGNRAELAAFAVAYGIICR